jgi:hypothetical protein
VVKRALALLALVTLAGGCKDDRKRVQMDVFLCNPTSHTADYDCGDGFVCYQTAQSVGGSICVPACDPNHPETCPGGACTAGGECLKRCSVPAADGGVADDCGNALLSCVRVTYAPGESGSGKLDGVCMPVTSTCTTSDDCGSPVFTVCDSETNGQQFNPDRLATTGSVCVQGGSNAGLVGCEPGSTCIRKVLPASISDAPDVCTPNCLRRKRASDGQTVDECLPGFSCLTSAFPQTTTRVCAPGFPGWLCTDPLGCVAGECDAWHAAQLDDFKTCSPTCTSDDDCLIYDHPGNPNLVTHFTCFDGHCHNLQSLFFPEMCVADRGCALDPAATCQAPPSPAPSPDPCSALASATMPLGALGGATSLCVRDCNSDADCAALSKSSHLPHACVLGRCAPSVPFLVPCKDDASCLPTLKCLPPPPGFPLPKVCTIACTSSADCTGNPALGSVFTCAEGECVPKTAAGCAPAAPVADLCLAGELQNGVCVSPNGWVCDDDKQCASGHCDRKTVANTLIGHCM